MGNRWGIPVASFMTNLLRTRFVHGSYVGRARFIRESYST